MARYVRNFLDLVLGSIPQIDEPRQQEIDGLPDEFDNWVFGIVARAIPSLTAAEDPRSLWQPIFDRGHPPTMGRAVLLGLVHGWAARRVLAA